MTVRLQVRFFNTTIIQVYAPKSKGRVVRLQNLEIQNRLIFSTTKTQNEKGVANIMLHDVNKITPILFTPWSIMFATPVLRAIKVVHKQIIVDPIVC